MSFHSVFRMQHKKLLVCSSRFILNKFCANLCFVGESSGYHNRNDNLGRFRWINRGGLLESKGFIGGDSRRATPGKCFQYAGYSTSIEHQLRRLDPDHPFETLRRSERYAELLYNESDSLELHVTHGAARSFIALTKEPKPMAPVTDEIYREVVSDLLKSLEELQDEELIEVMAAWAKFPSPKSWKAEPDIGFLKAMDDECMRRAVSRKKWICRVNFILADLWRSLGIANLSNFHWQFVKQLLRKIDGLSREELIRFCLCFSVVKSVPKSINLYAVEFNILRQIQQADHPLDSNEVAILCSALYKAKASLVNKDLMTSICETVIADRDKISASALIPISKAIRLGSHKRIEEDILRLLDAIAPNLKNYSVNTCAYLSFLGTRGRVKSDKLLTEIVCRVEGNLKEVKLRELEYLICSLSMFNVKCSTIYEEAVQEIRNVYTDPNTGKLNGAHTFSGSQFGRSIPKILNALVYAGIIPHDLISMAFSKEFLEAIYGNRMYTYTFDLLLLHENVLRDEESYAGNSLPDKAVHYLVKCNMEWIEPNKNRVSPYQRMCRKITESFSDIVKDPELFHVCNLLPHQQTIEIVFCKNPQGELVPVPDELKTIEDHLPKSLPGKSDSGLEYCAILMYFWDDFVYQSDELIGHARLMQKQVQRLGYTPYMICFWSWIKQETPEMQKKYLQQLTNI